MPTSPRDPRTLITPDAFHLSPDLLGTPLAAPWRRLWALLIDLAVVGALTALTSSLALFIWGGVGVFLVSMAFRSHGERLGRATGMLFRGATGCLGTIILAGVVIAFMVARGSDLGVNVTGPSGETVEVPGIAGVSGVTGLRGLAQGLLGMAAFGNAEDTVAAREAAETILSGLRAGGVDRAGLEETAREMGDLAGSDVAWRDEAETVLSRALAAVMETTPAAGAEPSEAESPVRGLTDAELDELRTDVETLTDREALAALGSLLEAGEPLEGPDQQRVRLLRARLLPLFAADTLAELKGDLRRSERRAADLRGELDAAEASLAETKRGFLGLLEDVWGQLGSALGLWSIYFTVALTVTAGRTVGKKLMGIRVLRLDGEPITWWTAFERAGGYAAGLATGLLGFAQVFWDPNRQCVHDKIMGTVVVSDGAQPIPGAWQEAWKADRGGTA